VTPVVVDTGVLIDHLRGVEAARDRLRALTLEHRPLLSSWLCRLEVRAGALQREVRRVDALLATIDWVPVDAGVLEVAETFALRFSASHRGVDAVDYVVAATCEVTGAELLTTNVKHFPMLDGVRRPY